MVITQNIIHIQMGDKIIEGRILSPEEVESKRTFYEDYIISDKKLKENLD